MRLLVCGSRTWTDETAIEDAIWTREPSVVIHGGHWQGADAMAAAACRRVGIKTETYPADWTKHGRAAGPIRNQQMIDEGKPDVVLAFRSDGKSNGTDDMIRRARAAGIPVEVISSPTPSHTESPT